MPVNSVHPDYALAMPKWSMIEDVIEGQDAIKAGGDTYLPRPNPEDHSAENKERYKTYLQRAVFYGVTKRTVNGLIGQVFTQDPVYKLPKLLETLETDIDGAQSTLIQQVVKSTRYGLTLGRAGLLVDYPTVEGAATKAQLDAGFIRPTILQYAPQDIINWRTVTIGAKVLLSLIVLQEEVVEQDDGFEAETVPQWRVLRLEEYGGRYIYKVELWRETEDTVFVKVAEYYPTNSAGQNLTEIPFFFIGSGTNTPEIDDSPIYDMCVLNIGHYRNSADYEEATFMVGQPTPYFTGLDKRWVDDVFKGRVYLGSRAAIPLPANSSAGLLQVSPNSMTKEAMEHKERQMVALGAKLVESNSTKRTLGEAKMEEASEVSTLGMIAKNVADAYRAALHVACDFVGANANEVEFDIPTDMMLGMMSEGERAQLIAEWSAGAITFEEMRYGLRKAGVAYLDDEEAKDTLGTQQPLALDDIEGEDQDGNDVAE